MSAAPAKSKSKSCLEVACGWFLIAVIAVVAIAVCHEPTTPEERATRQATREAERVAEAAQQAEKRVAKAAQKAEERRKGFHCLDDYDGNHAGLEELVKASLNAPSSLETLETLIGPVQDGKHRVRMDFTAKNQYGGRVRYTALADIDNLTCTAVLTSVDY